MKGKVSVIIPTIEGREHLLKRAVQSVKKQSYPDVEIVVVNEGKPAQEQRIIGIEKAKGEYIALLDDDDYWKHEKYLEKMISYMESNDLVMVSCAYYDERIKEVRIPKARNSSDLLVSFSNFETSATVFRKDAYQKAGGLDVRFKSEQNHDLFYRISKVGKFGVINEPMVVKGFTGEGIGTNRINKLQGYTLFHWKFKKDIIGLGVVKMLFMLSKFLLTVMMFVLVGNPTKLYEKVKIW